MGENVDDLVARLIRQQDRATVLLVAVILVVALAGAWALREVDQTVTESRCVAELEARFLVAVGDVIGTDDTEGIGAVHAANDQLRAFSEGDRSVCP